MKKTILLMMCLMVFPLVWGLSCSDTGTTSLCYLTTNETPSYSLMDSNGSIISTGNMTNITDKLYVLEITKSFNPLILNVTNGTETLLYPIGSSVSQPVVTTVLFLAISLFLVVFSFILLPGYAPISRICAYVFLVIGLVAGASYGLINPDTVRILNYGVYALMMIEFIYLIFNVFKPLVSGK